MTPISLFILFFVFFVFLVGINSSTALIWFVTEFSNSSFSVCVSLKKSINDITESIEIFPSPRDLKVLNKEDKNDHDVWKNLKTTSTQQSSIFSIPHLKAMKRSLSPSATIYLSLLDTFSNTTLKSSMKTWMFMKARSEITHFAYTTHQRKRFYLKQLFSWEFARNRKYWISKTKGTSMNLCPPKWR